MVRCIDCGLVECLPGEKKLGHCLWYKRAMSLDDMSKERTCEPFEIKDPKLGPFKQLELKLLLKSAESSQSHSNRVGRAAGFLRRAMETERLADVDELVGEACRSLCDENMEPLPEYGIVARQIDLVNAEIRHLTMDTNSKLMYEWRGCLGEDFGKDPNNFFLTPEQRIIWAKHSQYFKDKKKNMFLSIPFDCASFDIDELIDLLEETLRKAPIHKQILDTRADEGTPGDVGAFLAILSSKSADKFIPMCKLALESQRVARDRVIRKLRKMFEPLIIELEQLEEDLQLPPNTRDQNSKMLYELENNLRTFIVKKLEENFGEDWWNKGIPDDVQKNATQRKESKTLPPYYPKRSYHEIYYVDFADYSKIILQNDNWDNIFKTHFKKKEWTDVTLNELNPIRNDIAHNRQVDDIAHLTLLTNARKIQQIIQKQ